MCVFTLTFKNKIVSTLVINLRDKIEILPKENNFSMFTCVANHQSINNTLNAK